MSGPWEKFQDVSEPSTEEGPWAKFAEPVAASPEAKAPQDDLMSRVGSAVSGRLDNLQKIQDKVRRSTN